MEFNQKRRQQFLSEKNYLPVLAIHRETSEYFATHPVGVGDSPGHDHVLARQSVGDDRFHILLLLYTAGEPIESLRAELEKVIAAYERYGVALWDYAKDRNEPVFKFYSIDDYCQLMQLIGLCFLLHRRDLLPRLAALQDGLDATGRVGEGLGGTDTLYEEFMAYGLGSQSRYETDFLCCSKPYASLFHALTETTSDAGLKELNNFLRRWYKELSGCGWHDSHKPNEAGDQGGYYGYWSFEAGAAVLLLGIEDDSSLHKYLYYPKDMVAWSRAHTSLSTEQDETSTRLRCLAGEPCPREGWWFTPANTNSRRHFAVGEVMPGFGGDYGATIWQWDEQQ
jgi:Domain of unknown function (DUF1911)